MLRNILVYGTAAGLIVGAELFAITVAFAHRPPLPYAVAIGYLTMLVALSLVFVAIKRRRDRDLGGVIGFWPALVLGLGISAMAGIFYVLAWEAALAVTHMDFGASYAKLMIARAEAKGMHGAALARLKAEMAAFRADYARPLYRFTEGFTEIFPVGVLVSLVSAGLLCNSGFLPARRRPHQ